MSWEAVQLGDVIQTLKGYAFKSSHYVESGVPIVRASNFTMDSISNDNLKFYTQDEAAQFKKYELTTNDVLIQTVGSWESNPASVVGKVVRVPQLLNGALLNQNIVKVFPADTNQLNLQYLFYRLKCHDFKRHNIGNAVGAANQASITLETIRTFTFELPSLSTQKRIAEILKGYDDLIENNQEQIKLLEEAAQRLYKEWFVDLRFPGHETTPITDGIPKGWGLACLDDVISKITTGLNPRKNFTLGVGKNYYVTIKNMANNSIYLNDKCDKVDDEAIEKINKRSDLQVGDILFSGIGTIGRVYMIDIPTNNWNVSESVFTMRANDMISKEYLYLLLLSHDMQSYCDQNAHGVAQRGIRMADLRAYKFYLPNKSLLDSFTVIVKPLIEKTQHLRQQITLLEETRDRLLPKLMNGEIEV